MRPSSTPQTVSRRLANSRLSKEQEALRKHSPHGISAHPDRWDMLLWHFIIDGPENTPYEGGQYYGIIRFPNNYPLSAPEIQLFTHNGRFAVGQILFVEELIGNDWSPMDSISEILSALREVMADDEIEVSWGLKLSNQLRAGLARRSRMANRRLPIFRYFWP